MIDIPCPGQKHWVYQQDLQGQALQFPAQPLNASAIWNFGSDVVQCSHGTFSKVGNPKDFTNKKRDLIITLVIDGIWAIWLSGCVWKRGIPIKLNDVASMGKTMKRPSNLVIPYFQTKPYLKPPSRSLYATYSTCTYNHSTKLYITTYDDTKSCPSLSQWSM